MTPAFDDKTQFAAARTALERGTLARASRLLDALPQSDEVAFQRVRLARMQGDYAKALTLLEPTLARHPKELPLWLERAILARALGTGLPQAPAPIIQQIAAGQVPQLPPATGKWGKAVKASQAALAKGNLRAATTGLGEVPIDAPPAALALRARLLLATGQAAKARPIAAHVQKAHPLVPSALVLLARCLIALGALGQAVPIAVQAAEIAPSDVAAVRLAIQGLLEIGATARARLIWEAPGVTRAKLAMEEARLLVAESRPNSAAQVARKAAKTASDFAILARAEAGCGQNAAALAAYDASLKLGFDADVAAARAQLLQSLGQAAEAEAALRSILKARPDHGPAARALAFGTKLSAEDPVVALMEAPDAAKDPAMLFARAKVAADTGDDARMFAFLNRANAETLRRFPYSPDSDAQDEARITGPLSDLLRAAPNLCSTAALAPIFVTGMPRSGTTLVERVLAAHADVSAGGELGLLGLATDGLEQAWIDGQPPTPKALTQAADAYADLVTEHLGPLPARFTDKSIHTFAKMGLIARVLPKAHFVVVHRDPRDVALSIYRNQFREGVQRYSTDLAHIAHHYGLFHRLVAHWRAEGVPFHEIRYEALLSDPQTETRALLDACALPWDPACLAFHEHAGRIDTLSFAQARQPIYQSSKGGWRRFEAELQPFIEACAREGVSLDPASD